MAASVDSSISRLIDPATSDAITTTDDGIIVETQSAGVYADISDDQATVVLDQLTKKPWRQAVRDLFEKEKPWLYRIITDPSRSMPMELFELPQGATCLDVGSGWGQLSIPMALRGYRVVSLDLPLPRLRILLGIARQEGAPIVPVKGNILSFPFRAEPFDLVLFNGTLEWVGTGRAPGRTIRQCQVEALQRAARAIKQGGSVYVGIENAAGLKYFMGARDDHTSLVNLSFRSEREADAIMRSAGAERATAKTWGLNQLKQLVEEAGLKMKSVFGCFPDYKVPRHLVPLHEVNAFLLKSEVDWDEHHGDRGEAMPDQNAIRSAYRQLADNGIAQWFCPSYAMILVKS
jgi:SAM-dependent methyltransferase